MRLVGRRRVAGEEENPGVGQTRGRTRDGLRNTQKMDDCLLFIIRKRE